MKEKSAVMAVALIAGLVGMEFAEAQSADRAWRTETFSTSDFPAVFVSTSGGSIEVTGDAENRVQVEMFVRRRGRYLSPSDDDLSDFDIVIEQNGNEVIAEARRKRSGIFSGPRNISISFRVQVPQNATVEGKTSGGSVSAGNLLNGVNLRTSGGSVSATRVEGTVDLRTSGGSITIEEASGNIHARTSGGSISVRDLYGQAELSTSGGNIRLENISAAVTAKTSGGNIRGSFRTFLDDISLQTSGGNIRIDIPESGHYNLDLKGHRVDMKLHNFTGDAERNSVKGRTGNGGPLLQAKTSGGTVSVRYL